MKWYWPIDKKLNPLPNKPTNHIDQNEAPSSCQKTSLSLKQLVAKDLIFFSPYYLIHLVIIKLQFF